MRRREFMSAAGDSDQHRRAGFTLIELLLVIVILGIVAGVFVRYFDEGNRLFGQVDERRELRQAARVALLRIVRELRQVRSKTDVLAADATNFSFYGASDSLYAINFSGVPGDDVLFQWGAKTQIIADDVDSLAFEYFKSDGTAAVPLVSPAETDISVVTIFLRLGSGGTKLSLKTGTSLRNL